MKFALFNQLQMPKPWRENAEVLMYKEAITEAIHAEAVGFDAYWQTEHHFYTEIGHSSAPEIVLAALSQRTLHLRLGLGVVVLPCNHPYRVVEYVSTLDIISDGRVEFGTGRGASAYHVEAFGCAPDESKAMWEGCRPETDARNPELCRFLQGFLGLRAISRFGNFKICQNLKNRRIIPR